MEHVQRESVAKKKKTNFSPKIRREDISICVKIILKSVLN